MGVANHEFVVFFFSCPILSVYSLLFSTFSFSFCPNFFFLLSFLFSGVGVGYCMEIVDDTY